MIDKNRVDADPLPLTIFHQFLFGLLCKKRSAQVSNFNEPTPQKAKSNPLMVVKNYVNILEQFSVTSKYDAKFRWKFVAFFIDQH